MITLTMTSTKTKILTYYDCDYNDTDENYDKDDDLSPLFTEPSFSEKEISKKKMRWGTTNSRKKNLSKMLHLPSM